MEATNLHLRFLRAEPTADGFLELAREYGLLFRKLDQVADLARFQMGEPIAQWLHAWRELRYATRALNASKEFGREGVAESRVVWAPNVATYEDEGAAGRQVQAIHAGSWLWGHVSKMLKGEAARHIARHVAQTECNRHLREHTAVQLLGSSVDLDVDLSLRVRPLSLYGALWINLARTIGAGERMRVCQYCGNVFEAQRSSATYCPEELGTWCRKKAQRQPS